MALKPGTRLGPYEITAAIGAGGMGEVYRARDAKLRRDVAIKVLPADFTSDPDKRSRFLREARACAAVNHPNIATVYEVGEADVTTFIAMELVKGKTPPSLNSTPMYPPNWTGLSPSVWRRTLGSDPETLHTA